MKLLAIMRPEPGVDASSAVAAHAREELAELWRLYAEGDVREMYSPGRPGAVLVLEASSRQLAAETLATLPLLKSKTMGLELIELHPFKALTLLFRGDRADGRGGAGVDSDP